MNKIVRNFNSHQVEQHQAEKMQSLRELIAGLAWAIEAIVPEGREKALAMTKLEEAMFWANAGIARPNA